MHSFASRPDILILIFSSGFPKSSEASILFPPTDPLDLNTCRIYSIHVTGIRRSLSHFGKKVRDFCLQLKWDIVNMCLMVNLFLASCALCLTYTLV
jgi:hypothetical protein